MNDFLENLKVGDKVIVSHGFIDRYICIINSETPKYWKIRNDLYDKKTGRMRGSNIWNSSYITEATEKAIEDIKRKQNISKLNNFDFNKLNNNELIKLINIIGGKDE